MLMSITGQDFGYDLQAWHDYLKESRDGGYTWGRNIVLPKIMKDALASEEWQQATRRLTREVDMAFDESLAGRVEDALAREHGVIKKKMFGVACYMQRGHAFAGVWGDSLIVRIGPEAYDAALEEPHVREFDITGKPMKGWIVVGPDGIDDDSALREWLRRSLDFVNSLPRKEQKPPRKK